MFFQTLLVFSDPVLLILRLVFGAVFVAHGWPKIKDLRTNAQNFETMGFRPGIFWGTVAAVLEFVGGIMIIAGFLTQAIALLLAVEMLVALFKVNLKKGFAGGYEFDLVLAAMGLVLATTGGGSLALDSFLPFLWF